MEQLFCQDFLVIYLIIAYFVTVIAVVICLFKLVDVILRQISCFFRWFIYKTSSDSTPYSLFFIYLHTIYLALLMSSFGIFSWFGFLALLILSMPILAFWLREIFRYSKNKLIDFMTSQLISRAFYGIASVSLTLLFMAYLSYRDNTISGFFWVYSTILLCIDCAVWSFVFRNKRLPRQKAKIQTLRCVDAQALHSLWPLAAISIESKLDWWFLSILTVLLFLYFMWSEDVRPSLVFIIFKFHYYEVTLEGDESITYLLLSNPKRLENCSAGLNHVRQFSKFCLVVPEGKKW